MSEFLLEIGFEEIPASFLPPAAEALEQKLTDWFTENRIACGQARRFYTPRRLAVLFEGVADSQEARTVELQGPPKKAAFDAEGKPLKTALGFARTHGKEVSDLEVRTTPKGEYVFVTKTIAAEPTGKLLVEALPGIVAGLPFPKNMRWAAGGFRFARPIRWLVALLGNEVIESAVEDVTSGRVTQGPRLTEPGKAAIAEASGYVAALAGLGVVVDPVQRKQAIVTEVDALLRGTGGELVPDEELLDETTNIVEQPRPVLCEFRKEYLDLPPVVVITALKKHQRCFAVRDGNGELVPRFVAVTNTPGCDAAEVRGWYEKAAESRLRDARFFIEEDRKIGLEGFLKQEGSVTWIEGLGTLADKTARLVKLSAKLSSGMPGVDLPALARAALLCKADLLSNMIREKEYTSLQGAMGGIYARLEGEPETVAQAIAEVYRPRSIGDPLPGTAEGRMLSIADRLDNICASFLTGAIPTGSEDPFALRRQATGMLLMVLDLGGRFDLRTGLHAGLELLGRADAELETKLEGFFRERLSLLLADRGVSYDAANAVLAQSWYDPADAEQRARALGWFREQEQAEFERLVVGQKRVANILRGTAQPGKVDDRLLAEPAEKALCDAARALAPGLGELVAAGDYRAALVRLLSLRPVIDRFFEEVMVMCDDPQVSVNRRALVAYVKSLFLQCADLSQIVIS